MSTNGAFAIGWTSVLDPADTSDSSRRALRAWLALQHALAYEPARAKRALAGGGGPAIALRSLLGTTPDDVLRDAAFARETEQLAQVGARLVPLGASEYPARLADLSDAAPLLGVRGAPGILGALPFVAIVGARAPTRLGLEFAFQLARDLAGHDVGVVSGLARGIDAAAHRGALAGRGRTVAVLGCGLERVYPSEHRALADEIAERGAVVSELPVGTPPLPHHFPLRNRLISGLALAVVVVEARLRSGSLVTAQHAANQGREVLAVPGPVGAPTSEGPNRLLRAGAWPALDVSDVLEAIGIGAASPRERAGRDARDGGGRDRRARALCDVAEAPAARSRSKPSEPEGLQQRAVLACLRHEPLTRDELGARLGTSAAELARILLPLELDGRIAEERDGRLRVAGDS